MLALLTAVLRPQMWGQEQPSVAGTISPKRPVRSKAIAKPTTQKVTDATASARVRPDKTVDTKSPSELPLTNGEAINRSAAHRAGIPNLTTRPPETEYSTSYNNKKPLPPPVPVATSPPVHADVKKTDVRKSRFQTEYSRNFKWTGRPQTRATDPPTMSAQVSAASPPPATEAPRESEYSLRFQWPSSFRMPAFRAPRRKVLETENNDSPLEFVDPMMVQAPQKKGGQLVGGPVSETSQAYCWPSGVPHTSQHSGVDVAVEVSSDDLNPKPLPVQFKFPNTTYNDAFRWPAAIAEMFGSIGGRNGNRYNSEQSNTTAAAANGHTKQTHDVNACDLDGSADVLSCEARSKKTADRSTQPAAGLPSNTKDQNVNERPRVNVGEMGETRVSVREYSPTYSLYENESENAQRDKVSVGNDSIKENNKAATTLTEHEESNCDFDDDHYHCGFHEQTAAPAIIADTSDVESRDSGERDPRHDAFSSPYMHKLARSTNASPTNIATAALSGQSVSRLLHPESQNNSNNSEYTEQFASKFNLRKTKLTGQHEAVTTPAETLAETRQRALDYQSRNERSQVGERLLEMRARHKELLESARVITTTPSATLVQHPLSSDGEYELSEQTIGSPQSVSSNESVRLAESVLAKAAARRNRFLAAV